MPTMYHRLSNLYDRIDAQTHAHFARPGQKQAPCARGCASCCSQFFEISLTEFLMIIHHLKSLPPDQLEGFVDNTRHIIGAFREHYPDFARTYFTSFKFNDGDDRYYSHPQRFAVHMPCPFLSPAGACGIYPVRPLICRTTGVGFKKRFEWGAICNEIRNGFLAHLWQADLRPFNDEITAVCWVATDDGYMRQYPMFYMLYQFFIAQPDLASHPLVDDFMKDSVEDYFHKLTNWS